MGLLEEGAANEQTLPVNNALIKLVTIRFQKDGERVFKLDVCAP